MIKDILVCLEGSRSSDAATRAAIEIARERHAGLVGMAIVDEPDIRAGTPASIGGSSFKHGRDETLLADARTHAKDWLGTFERRCCEEGMRVRVIETVGGPAEAIIGEMRHHDLTVMGRDANFRFETESEDTSTHDKILRRAPHPVLLIPDSEAAASLGRKVLIAYDGGEPAEHALASFMRSGLAESREIHVATVGDDGEKAWEIANGAVEKLRTFGIKAFAHSIVSLLPTSEALVKMGSDLGVGLFVMGAFAHSRLAEMIRGSGTRNIMEHSTAALCLQH